PRADLSRASERAPADSAPPLAGVRRLDGVVRGGARAATLLAEGGPAPGRPGSGGRPGPPRPAAQLQRRAADRGSLQAVASGEPQPAEGRRRALEAADRLRERADVRVERRHAARRRQGLLAHTTKR